MRVKKLISFYEILHYFSILFVPVIGHVSYGGFAGNIRYNNPGRIDGSNHQYTGVGGNNRNTYSRRSGSNRSFGQRQNTGTYGRCQQSG